MSRIFATSDTHFGHHNIIRYCSRPFRSTGKMDNGVISRWNSYTSDDDVIFHLGDFAMGPRVDEDSILRYFRRLGGNIKIMIGNHDEPSKWGPGLADIIRRRGDEVAHVEVLEDEVVEIKVENRTFVLSHRPLDDWHKKKSGSIHLHGHLHTVYCAEDAAKQVLTHKYDVGYDMFGGPVRLTSDLRFLDHPKGWLSPED